MIRDTLYLSSPDPLHNVQVVSLIQKCSEVNGEAVQLGVVRALLTVTTAEHFVLHGDALISVSSRAQPIDKDGMNHAPPLRSSIRCSGKAMLQGARPCNLSRLAAQHFVASTESMQRLRVSKPWMRAPESSRYNLNCHIWAQAVRTVFNIAIGADSADLQRTARSALLQMLNTVVKRIAMATVVCAIAFTPCCQPYDVTASIHSLPQGL